MSQRDKRNRPHAQFGQRRLKTIGFDPTVQDVIAGLVNDAGRAKLFQDGMRFTRALAVIAGNAGIKRATGPNDMIQRTHGFFQWCIGIEAVRIEDIDVIQPHAFQALIARRDQIFA